MDALDISFLFEVVVQHLKNVVYYAALGEWRRVDESAKFLCDFVEDMKKRGFLSSQEKSFWYWLDVFRSSIDLRDKELVREGSHFFIAELFSLLRRLLSKAGL